MPVGGESAAVTGLADGPVPGGGGGIGFVVGGPPVHRLGEHVTVGRSSDPAQLVGGGNIASPEVHRTVIIESGDLNRVGVLHLPVLGSLGRHRAEEAGHVVVVFDGDRGIRPGGTFPGTPEHVEEERIQSPHRAEGTVFGTDRNAEAVTGVGIHRIGCSQLLDVSGTFDGVGGIPRPVQRRQQHRRQNRDDRNFIYLRKQFFYVNLCQRWIEEGLMTPLGIMYNNICKR